MFESSAYYLKIKRNNIRKKLIEIKGGKCILCGYCKCFQAFELHHRDPKAKRFKLSGINLTKYTWTEILDELKKTDLLCANCHAEINANPD